LSIKCPKCGKSFSGKSEFMQHGKDEHKMSEIEMNMNVSMRGQMTTGPSASDE